ncbi:hypothetical protein AB0A77_20465 [Streptomyces varsoviensis]|uniref:hypothetical protein n=1 Tax=Streptomyces varsoviensis TaxID=67373 RepID=UPI0033CBC240
MTQPFQQTAARRRMDDALDNLAVVFRGMTAHPDEHNCQCHWGSKEDLALLKTPDTELSADLLRRTWQATDWDYEASVLRRVLPQFASALTSGLIEPVWGMHEAGLKFHRAKWEQWPAEQAAAVQEFLDAWWDVTLIDPEPAVSADEVFALCAEATGVLGPWLRAWERHDHGTADQHLARAVGSWEYDLLDDQLPWDTWHNADDMRDELTNWLLRHASARLRAHGAPEELLHRVRLFGLSGLDRWEDPHYPRWSGPRC